MAKKKNIILLLIFLYSISTISAYTQECKGSRWILSGDGIRWEVKYDNRLPHTDHIEMSGRKISAIISYGADSSRNLWIHRDLIWPSQRRALLPGEAEWMKFRNYFRKSFDTLGNPCFFINGIPGKPGSLKKIEIEEYLKINHETNHGIEINRTLFPSISYPVFIEQWTFENKSNRSIKFSALPDNFLKEEEGEKEKYVFGFSFPGIKDTLLPPGGKITSSVCFFSFQKDHFTLQQTDPQTEKKARKDFVDGIRESLDFQSPDPVLNRAFELAKIRSSESLFETRQGLVHSPGGGRYYGGVWANDQVEYAGPFFPFLGYEPAIEASINAYRIFAKDMKPDFTPIWSSHEMEGDYPCCGKDRGDAAMYAYGASRFALAQGDASLAEELWKPIVWALEYCERRKTPEGVIASETDEMEGRIPTGTSNLSTSSLTYGALISASYLAGSLGKKDTAALFNSRAEELRKAIERFFGADINGYSVYRYYDGHQKLRHWMCLPLTMGIYDRKEGISRALFDSLWTVNGLNVENGENMFWDRGTLYALRGIIASGNTSEGLAKLKAYSCTRLLGEHVPYPVEAWPEGNQAHLAAESALYCRIFTEGLLGMEPTGLRSFSCTPRLPESWNKMELRNIYAFGNKFDIQVSREKSMIRVVISTRNGISLDKKIMNGESIHFSFQ